MGNALFLESLVLIVMVFDDDFVVFMFIIVFAQAVEVGTAVFTAA